jgi:hypothetical protein
VNFDHAHLVLGDFFPLFTTIDAFIKISHAFFDIATKHIFNLNFSLASADDLIAYFGHQTTHSLGVAVRGAEFKNHTHTVQNFWHQLWNVFRLGQIDSTAGVLQNLKESKTVLRCLKFFTDLASKLFKLRVVRASRFFKNLNDAD